MLRAESRKYLTNEDQIYIEKFDELQGIKPSALKMIN
jgi:hypothetical protein